MLEETITPSVSPTRSTTSWYGLNYSSRPVPGLPRKINLGSLAIRCTYNLEYAREDQESNCKKLVLGCMERGENIAEDLYKDDSELKLLFRYADVFTIRKVPQESSDVEKVNESIDALIVIQPSMLARTMDTCLAHLHIFISEPLSRDQSFNDALINLSVSLTSELDLGYTRCLVNVSTALPSLVAAYRRAGFITVATIPQGIKLTGQQRTTDDLIMAKGLGLPARQRRSVNEILSLCERLCDTEREVIDSMDAGKLLPLSFLPRPYVFHNGFEINVRALRIEDASVAHDIWRRAAEKGQGYGLDECPTLDMFKLMILSQYYCVVFEDPSCTNSIVGLTLISDSSYTRNNHSRFGQSCLFISERYRGRGLGSESAHLELTLLKELGYIGSLNDALLSNTHMNRTLKHSPLPPLTLGVVPDGTYTAGWGWDDQVIALADFSQSDKVVLNFVEASENSLQRRGKTAAGSCSSFSNCSDSSNFGNSKL